MAEMDVSKTDSSGRIEIIGVFPAKRRKGCNRHQLKVDVTDLETPMIWLAENFRSLVADLLSLENQDFIGVVIPSNIEVLASYPLYLPFQNFSEFNFEQILDLTENFTQSRIFIDLAKPFIVEITTFR